MNFYKPYLSLVEAAPFYKVICLLLIINTAFSSLSGQALEGEAARLIEASLVETNLSASETLVSYTYDYRANVNPLKIEYQYIQKNDSEKMSLPASSFLDHFDLHLDDHVELIAIGDDYVDVPHKLAKDQKLDSQNVVYELKSDGNKILSYDLTISDRVVIGEESILIKGESKEAIIVRSEFKLNKILRDGSILTNDHEVIFDWYVSDLGLVKRSREPFNNSLKTKSTDTAFVTIYN